MSESLSVAELRLLASSWALSLRADRKSPQTLKAYGDGSRVQVYSPSEERRRRFAEEMSEVCQNEVVPVPRPEMAAEDKDIIITATTSREPVLNGHWIAEGTHVNAIGSNFLGKVELDVVAIRRATLVVVDSKDQARLEAGDFQQALEDGSLHWTDVRELGQVVVGRFPGRERATASHACGPAAGNRRPSGETSNRPAAADDRDRAGNGIREGLPHGHCHFLPH